MEQFAALASRARLPSYSWYVPMWRATLALMEGAGAILSPGGVLLTYGPYRRDGRHTAPSNAEFDASLRSRNAEWGVRDIADLERLAADNGLRLAETFAMPANNMILVFERS